MPILEHIFVSMMFIISIIFPLWGLYLLLISLILGEKSSAALHIQCGNIPLYLTEVVLVGIIINHIARCLKSKEHPKLLSEYHSGWFVFYTNAFISLLRGMSAFRFIEVMRDFALAYYSLFKHITSRYITDMRQIRSIGSILLVIVLLKCLLATSGLGKIIGVSGSMAGSANSLYLACALAASVFLYPLWSKNNTWWFGTMVIFVTLLVQMRVRASWIGFIASMLFYTISSISMRRGGKVEYFRIASILLLGFSLAYILPEGNVFDSIIRKMARRGETTVSIANRTINRSDIISDPQSKTFREHVRASNISTEIRSLAKGVDSDNLKTRLWMWVEIIEQLFGVHLNIHNTVWRDVRKLDKEHRAGLEYRLGKTLFSFEIERPIPRFLVNNPVLRALTGVPFGEKLVPGRVFWWVWDTDRYDPHNSHMAILYRMGVIGFLAYVIMLLSVFWRGWRYATRCPDRTNQHILLALLGCLLVHSVHSAADVTLENSYRGVIFWVIWGLIEVIIRNDITVKGKTA
ncbi:MAG TPA: hypothetical protein PK876_09005 [Elusimicrobiota bacterium]|nr:hypothetical protein [Elusimicrobiota bacterium]